MRISKAGREVVLVTAMVFAAAAAFASIVNYGDYAGSSLTYTQVSEASITDPVPLFGAPTISGDTLDFDPLAFGATSTGATAPDITDGQLNFGIDAMDGYSIPSVTISEQGDFTLEGQGTQLTLVAVATPVILEVNAVDGMSIDTLTFNGFMSFAPPAGIYDVVTYPGIAMPWSGSLTFDVDQLLADKGIDFTLGATSIDIALDNTLVAISELESTATILKKDIKITPEPSTIGLVLLGLVAAAHARRRR